MEIVAVFQFDPKTGRRTRVTHKTFSDLDYLTVIPHTKFGTLSNRNVNDDKLKIITRGRKPRRYWLSCKPHKFKDTMIFECESLLSSPDPFVVLVARAISDCGQLYQGRQNIEQQPQHTRNLESCIICGREMVSLFELSEMTGMNPMELYATFSKLREQDGSQFAAAWTDEFLAEVHEDLRIGDDLQFRMGREVYVDKTWSENVLALHELTEQAASRPPLQITL